MSATSNVDVSSPPPKRQNTANGDFFPGEAKTMDEFIRLFELEDSTFDLSRQIWTIDRQAYVCLGRECSETSPLYDLPICPRTCETSPPYDLTICLRTFERNQICLYLYSENLSEEEVMPIRLHLISLPENQWKKTAVCKYPGHGTCIISDERLQACLSQNQVFNFRYNLFTPSQGRLLANCGTDTKLIFHSCQFLDGGTEFFQCLQDRADDSGSPAHLCLSEHNPFDQGKLEAILGLSCLRSTTVEFSASLIDQTWRSMTIKAKKLILHYDEEASDGIKALVELVRSLQSARELHLKAELLSGKRSFYWNNLWKPLLSTLGSSPLFLKSLCMTISLDGHETLFLKKLVRILPRNKGLTELAVDGIVYVCCVPWTKLWKAISAHPSLMIVDFKNERSSSHIPLQLEDKPGLTETIAQCLLVNQRLEQITFHDGLHHRELWDSEVAPILQCNGYRNRAKELDQIKDTATRAAVLGAALFKKNACPTASFLLIQRHHVGCFGRGAAK